MKLKTAEKNRIFFVDEMRGLAVLCMIFYHTFYVFDTFFSWKWAGSLFDFFMPVQPFFAGVFIFICGVSCTFSRSNLKRGLILLGVALGFTLVTAVIMPRLGFAECEIYFGILHFLAVSIIIYALFSKLLPKVPPAAGIILCAVLYPFMSNIENGFLSYGELFTLRIPDMLYETDFLMPLGIYSESFYSADYFPLFPDIFIFFSGVFAGFYFADKGWPEWVKKKRIDILAFLGRYTLPIYVVHIPVAYATGYIINLFLN